MANTVEGGKKTARTNMAKEADYYKRRAAEGHKAWRENGRKPRGFSLLTQDQVKAVGSKGGKASVKAKQARKSDEK